MTKRQMMVRAHQIARNLEGNYSARLSYALRKVWQIAKLVGVGGSEWQKASMHRIYFNDLATWLGLEVDRYKTGNICSAKLDGERISNTQAGKVLGRLASAKVWFDVATEAFHGKDISSEDFDLIVANIKAAKLPVRRSLIAA